MPQVLEVIVDAAKRLAIICFLPASSLVSNAFSPCNSFAENPTESHARRKDGALIMFRLIFDELSSSEVGNKRFLSQISHRLLTILSFLR